MTREGLTAKQVEHAKADPQKRVEVPVGLPTGLYLVIHQTGRKSWAFRYRWHGKPSKLTFGTYPKVTLGAARAEANAAIDELKSGKDPSVTKTEDNREPNSAEAVAKEWLERDVRPRTRTAYEVGRIVNKEILPAWKNKLITEIARPDLMRLLDKIADRGAVSSRNHALSILKRMLNWAVQRGYLQFSPAATIKPLAGERSRDRVLSEDELRDVWNAAPALGYPWTPFLQILILTAQRRGEVAGMKWEDVDLLGKAVWALSAEQTKAARAHDVPLSKQVIEILKGLPRFQKGSHVFTTTSGEKPIVGFSKAKRNLEREIARMTCGEPKWKADYTLHDFRRSCATWLAQQETPPHILSAVLGHSAGSTMGVTQIYNRFQYGPERRAALEKWTAYVTGLAKQKKLTRTA